MPTRYMTVEHNEDTNLELIDGEIRGKIPIHHLMSNYYWTRLDADHILLVGQHSLATHKALDEHPKTVLLPHIHHRKTIHEHYQQKDKMKHHDALSKNLSLEPHHTMQELIDAAIEKHGIIFAPKI